MRQNHLISHLGPFLRNCGATRLSAKREIRKIAWESAKMAETGTLTTPRAFERYLGTNAYECGVLQRQSLNPKTACQPPQHDRFQQKSPV